MAAVIISTIVIFIVYILVKDKNKSDQSKSTSNQLDSPKSFLEDVIYEVQQGGNLKWDKSTDTIASVGIYNDDHSIIKIAIQYDGNHLNISTYFYNPQTQKEGKSSNRLNTKTYNYQELKGAIQIKVGESVQKTL